MGGAHFQFCYSIFFFVPFLHGPFVQALLGVVFPPGLELQYLTPCSPAAPCPQITTLGLLQARFSAESNSHFSLGEAFQ